MGDNRANTKRVAILHNIESADLCIVLKNAGRLQFCHFSYCIQFPKYAIMLSVKRRYDAILTDCVKNPAK